MKINIDLWFGLLGVSAGSFHDYWPLLDIGEQTKAGRFLLERDRARYVASHGKLRLILASYLNLAPNKIRFKEGPYGKPEIGDCGECGVQFNMSHSGDRLMVAIGRIHSIGIDIEVWNDALDCPAVVDLCFADSERLFWSVLPSVKRQEFFFRLWTRKESFVKAIGMGLEINVAEVITDPYLPGRFLSLPTEYGPPQDWKLIDLELGSGVSGALTLPSSCQPDICYKRL